VSRVCANPGCDRPLGDRRDTARYCDTSCRTAAHRLRHEAEDQATPVKRSQPGQTQAERVLAALKAVGARGITAYDFAVAPPDGGRRIMRLGARILELKEASHRIETAGRRDGHVVYVLSGVEVAPAPVGLPLPGSGEGGGDLSPGQLFDTPAPPPAEHWEAA